jgi:hypothetical protein
MLRLPYRSKKEFRAEILSGGKWEKKVKENLRRHSPL